MKKFSVIENFEVDSQNVNSEKHFVEEYSSESGSDNFFNPWDPPLTKYIRSLRQRILSDFMYDKCEKTLENNLIETNEEQETNKSILDHDYFSDSVSTVLKKLEIFSDGGGFIDDTWELIIDRDSFRLWRKPYDSPNLGDENKLKDSPLKYEYRGK